jgi:hypothetical protein
MQATKDIEKANVKKIVHRTIEPGGSINTDK